MRTSAGIAPARLFGGALLLALALAAAIALALDRAGALGAPGCGPRSACAQAAAGPFGSLPWLGWPMSYVGSAWFAGLLAGWLLARGEVGVGWRRLVRAGAALSLFQLGVLAALKLACPYCLAVHGAGLAFLLLLETSPQSLRVRGSPLLASAAVASLAALALAGMHAGFAGAARERAESDLRDSTGRVLAAQPEATGFAGRHRRGSADALARIVVFTGYQCPDCRQLEGQLEQLLAGASDVALSVKHFPLDSSCNRHSPALHPNACWAARAAEAAAAVGGEEGFWRMHRWLFARGGSFTSAELDAGLAELGFERARFVAAMHAPATLAAVQADIEEGVALGLTQTPMVFVNGVELKGWQAPDALARTVGELRARGATPAADDRPPSARERHLAAWRAAPVEVLPPETWEHALGPADAKVRVVLFGDYQEPYTCQADVALRDLALSRTDVRYAFRHYPVNTACNPAAEQTMHKLACLAALGAEALGLLRGEDGFWMMHDWIVANRERFDDGTLTAAAAELGIERQAFWEAMVSQELQNRLAEDTLAAQGLKLTSIPLIFVNGRRVDRWLAGGEDLLPSIVAEAAR